LTGGICDLGAKSSMLTASLLLGATLKTKQIPTACGKHGIPKDGGGGK